MKRMEINRQINTHAEEIVYKITHKNTGIYTPRIFYIPQSFPPNLYIPKKFAQKCIKWCPFSLISPLLLQSKPLFQKNSELSLPSKEGKKRGRKGMGKKRRERGRERGRSGQG